MYPGNLQFDGSRLNALRLEKGWTMREVAKKVGVVPSAISRWENNLQQPRKPQAVKLAKVLGVAFEELFLEGNA